MKDLKDLRCQLRVLSDIEAVRDKALFLVKEKFKVEYRSIEKGYVFSFDCYVYNDLLQFIKTLESVNISLLVYSTNLDLVSFMERKNEEWRIHMEEVNTNNLG